jgi:translation initiation factor IF-3
VGIVSLDHAREAASEAGMDLVEVAANARPPVVRVMDYGKHRYEQQKAAKEAKKKQHTVDLKELKMRPKIGDHDLDFKMRKARGFLGKGNKVKITMRYRGREMRRPENGIEVMDGIVERLDDVAKVEARDRRLEGRQLTMVLVPKQAG